MTFHNIVSGTRLAAFVLMIAAAGYGQARYLETTEEAKTDKAESEKSVAQNDAGQNPTSDRGTTVIKRDVAKADADTVAARSGSSDRKWHFAVAPYIYLTAISGPLGARGRSGDIDLSIGDVLSHFKAGFMGSFEARRGRLIIFNDLLWTKLTEERETPGRLYDRSKVSVNMTVWNPMGGVRLAENDRGSFDLLGGVRVTSVKAILSFTTGTLPGFDVEQRKTWAAPVVGGHALINLSDKIFLSSIFDAGGGFGTHFTGQFYGGAGYKLTPRVAMVGGYRFLKNDYSDDSGFLFDTGMNGLVLGAKFSF